MRSAPTCAGRLAPLAIACFLALVLAPSVARAQETERFNLSAFGAYDIERFHSPGADTAGLSSNSSPDGGLLIDFRVIDLPMGKLGHKPALHLTGGITSTSRLIGPPLEGTKIGVARVLDLSGGAMLELPLEVLVKGNAGVSLRVGWDGGYLLTSTSDTGFLLRSKQYWRTSISPNICGVPALSLYVWLICFSVVCHTRAIVTALRWSCNADAIILSLTARGSANSAVSLASA